MCPLGLNFLTWIKCFFYVVLSQIISYMWNKAFSQQAQDLFLFHYALQAYTYICIYILKKSVKKNKKNMIIDFRASQSKYPQLCLKPRKLRLMQEKPQAKHVSMSVILCRNSIFLSTKTIPRPLTSSLIVLVM